MPQQPSCPGPLPSSRESASAFPRTPLLLPPPLSLPSCLETPGASLCCQISVCSGFSEKQKA
jgi:hypothetical protein